MNPGSAPSDWSDSPSAYIPRDRRRAIAAGITLPSRVTGAALFADLSGFTPLTELLARELGADGASEALTGHLNRVFHALIEELDRYGGDVIYFSGDAITCWLDEDDGSRAAASGVAMQAALASVGQITTPGGVDHRLALKITIAVGAARRFVVGDPDLQLIDVLAGSLVDTIAEVEALAQPGEILLHHSACDRLGPRVELSETRHSPATGEVGILGRLVAVVPETPAEHRNEARAIAGDLARPWVLREVYERLISDGGRFLAELRPAYPIFVNFTGIDYDADGDAHHRLDGFVRAAQRVLASYGGNVLQLTLGDKGAYLFGVFGTPVAHEDDAARVCAAALELRALEATTSAMNLRTGVSYGRLLSGTYGHEHRRTFACLGDPTNLAARLMSTAPAGSIFVSDAVRRNAGRGFDFAELEPLRLKGKSQPIVAHVLNDTSLRSPMTRVGATPMIGREQELAWLVSAADAATAGQGGVRGVSAEAGLGKSRLVQAFAEQVEDRLVVAFGECQPYGRRTPYFAWQEIWTKLLRLDVGDGLSDQLSHVQHVLGSIGPELVERASLLGAVLGLPFPDSDLTRSFDPELRKTSLEDLLSVCLRSLARDEPIVVVIEDCHWLDPLSRDLLEVLSRVALTERVLFVLAYRPDPADAQGLRLEDLAGMEECALDTLADDQMAAVVRVNLARALGHEAELGHVETLVIGRAEGNPFYAEELINYLIDQDLDLSDEYALRSVEFPDSIHSLILSRIDALMEARRRTLKVASVLGRSFEGVMLPGVYPPLGELSEIRQNLDALTVTDLLQHELRTADAYLFKHAAIRDVAYGSLPYAVRATLHTNVGRYFESETETIDRRLDLLAHHYGHGDDEDKKREYLGRAAVAARQRYANASAIEYYERLAPLVPEADRVDVLLALGQVLELVGQLDRARAVAENALALAAGASDQRAEAWCETALAEVARRQNRFEETAERLERARNTFAGLGDDEGLGRVMHLAGTLATQRGKLSDARALYEGSLAVRTRLGDSKMMASVLSNLGIVAEYEGDYALARTFHEQALDLRVVDTDRWAIAVSMTNLGMIAALQARHAEARSSFEEAMRLNREVGDTWMVAISHNNLGNAHRGLGDYANAASHYAACLRAHQQRDDGWALAFLLEDVARLVALSGHPGDALELLGAADALREGIGSPRGDALERQIVEDIESSAARLEPAERLQLRQRGRNTEAPEAIERALALVDALAGLTGSATSS